jgi:ribosome-binding factor A
MERVQRVNELIKEEVGQIILKEFGFPTNVLVTLTRVEVTPNLIEARIYISTMPQGRGAEILQILNSRVYEVQRKLNRRLNMRPMPKIMFIEERATVEAGRVEELLEQIKSQKTKK